MLAPYAGTASVVLALPRGGVPVAAQIARALHAPLDVFVVRKLGAPGRPELAIGAIAPGGVVVRNEDAIAHLGVTDETIAAIAETEGAELERRERLYRDGKPGVQVDGKTVILVDDGLATGSSMFAAVRALRALHPARIVVAVPVAPPDTVVQLARHVDAVVAAEMPEPFGGVGAWYGDFHQVSDEEVRNLLA